MQGETFDENAFADFLKDNIINEPKKNDVVSVPQKDSVSIIMDALKEFYDKNLKDQEFDVKVFMDFMEPKFAEAGYREGFATHPEARKTMGGG